MSTVDWPEALIPQTCSLRLRKSGNLFTSPFNGNSQATDFMSERWMLSVQLAELSRRNSHGLESFLNLLAGGVNRVRGWHFGQRGVPRGTLRGSPTLASAAVQGAQTIVLAGVPNGATLLADDLLQVSGQLVQCAANAVAAGGQITVQLSNHLRATVGSGAAVQWSRPTADFVMPAMEAGALYSPGRIAGAALDLVERW